MRDDFVSDQGVPFVGVLRALGAVAMIPFAAGFAMHFFTSDREHHEGFGLVIVAALVTAWTTIGAGLAALTVLGLRRRDLDDSTRRALWELSKAAYAFSILLVILAAGGAATASCGTASCPGGSATCPEW